MNFINKIIEKIKLFILGRAESITYFINENLRIKFTSLLTNLIPDKDITKTSILFYIIASFCLIAIVWGSLARIDMVVRGTGEVIPASKIKVIQSVFPGVIEKININLGDKVLKGDVLFVVDEVKTKASYISNERAFEAALLEVETLEKRTKIIEDLVNQGAESEMRLLDERLRLVESKKNLAQIESNRAVQKQQLEQTKIIAPSNGTINEVFITTIGAVVSTAEVLARLVPEDEKLVLQVYIEPKDISFVENGMKAKVSFTTYDPSIYGTFDGFITDIGATTTEVKDRGVFYEARVEVKDEKTKDIIIQSGMSAEISLIGQKRTVFGYIFSPVTKLKRKAFREK